MAAGDKWISCDIFKSQLGDSQILRTLLVDDGQGNPALRTWQSNASGGSGSIAVSTLQSDVITGNSASDFATKFAAWQLLNGSRNFVGASFVAGSDGSTGLIIVTAP